MIEPAPSSVVHPRGKTADHERGPKTGFYRVQLGPTRNRREACCAVLRIINMHARVSLELTIGNEDNVLDV